MEDFSYPNSKIDVCVCLAVFDPVLFCFSLTRRAACGYAAFITRGMNGMLLHSWKSALVRCCMLDVSGGEMTSPLEIVFFVF